MRIIPCTPAVILQRRDEFMRMGPAGGPFDFFLRRVRIAIADIIPYRPVEQVAILRNDRNMTAQTVLCDMRRIMPAN